jgi:hypothetical protein
VRIVVLPTVVTGARNCTERRRPNAKECGDPLVVRCKFGAVTNSRALTGTQTTAGLDVI